MVNYANGKIYGIRSSQTGKIYIGSTAKKYLSNRKTHHICLYKKWVAGTYTTKITSFQLLEYDDAEFYLIENYPCQSRDELRMREEYWIQQNSDKCVNLHRAFLTPENRHNRDKIYSAQYHLDHLDVRRADSLARSSRIIHCLCGKDYRFGHRNRHLATTKHIRNFILA